MKVTAGSGSWDIVWAGQGVLATASGESVLRYATTDVKVQSFEYSIFDIKEISSEAMFPDGWVAYKVLLN